MKAKDWGPQQYKEAYEGGAFIDEIAWFVGKSYSTIHYHLKRAGVQFRGRTEHINGKKDQ